MTDRSVSPDRVRTVFIGTGAFAVPVLRALADAPETDLVGIVTAPARPAGRRADPRASPVDDDARDLGITMIQAPERLRAPDAVAAVLALRPHLIVLADYGQIVPGALLAVAHGALNLHPSLLPLHRGAAPIPATILAGDSRTGVTLMRMDEGLDTGPIVAADSFDLTGHETASGLAAALSERAAALLRRSLPAWVRGDLTAQPQPAVGATLTRPLRRDDGRLDPSRSAAFLEQQVRALQPWPGSWFDVPSGRFTVWRADVLPDAVAAATGTERIASPGDLRARGRALVLQTADGVLELVEVQPAGGRRMSGEEVLRGRPALLHEHVAPPVPGLARMPLERPVGYSRRP